jgi:hypothetical protein
MYIMSRYLLLYSLKEPTYTTHQVAGFSLLSAQQTLQLIQTRSLPGSPTLSKNAHKQSQPLLPKTPNMIWAKPLKKTSTVSTNYSWRDQANSRDCLRAPHCQPFSTKLRVTIHMIDQLHAAPNHAQIRKSDRHKTRGIIQSPVIVVLPDLRVQQVLHLDPRRRPKTTRSLP